MSLHEYVLFRPNVMTFVWFDTFAAALAQGDLLLFLNSDTILEDSTISTSREFLLEHEDIAVVGCRLTFPDGRPQSSAFRFPSLRGICLTLRGGSACWPVSRAGFPQRALDQSLARLTRAAKRRRTPIWMSTTG